MTRPAGFVMSVLAILAALVLANQCGRWSQKKLDAATSRDVQDNSTVARLAYENLHQAQQFKRERDSTSKVIRSLERRVASQTSPVATASGGTQSPAVMSAPVVRDTLIASLVAGRAQDSLQILFLTSELTAYRDTLVPAIQKARDGWKQQAKQPRYTYTDIAGGLIAGWAIARDDGGALKLGAGLIVLPRLYNAVKNLVP